MDKNEGMNPLGRPLTIVFALVGKTFTSKFLLSWTSVFNYCLRHAINPLISNQSLSNIYQTRNQCLGGINTRGVDQAPFNDELPYDYVMWIDSEMVFSVENFLELLKKDEDIIAGAYLRDNGKDFSCVEKLDNDYFVQNGQYEYLSGDEVLLRRKKKQESVLEVEYTGMGWMLVKKGVFEKMKYPWFKPEWFEFKTRDASGNENTIQEFTSEEMGFCMTAKNLGFVVKVDTNNVVGVEKNVVLA